MRSFDLIVPFTKRAGWWWCGGGGGGGEHRNRFRSGIWYDLSVYRVLQISLFICDVSPFLDQVFRCLFSMDNLRGFGEDEPSSSYSLGRSGAKLPSSSEGPSAPLPAQVSTMAGSSAVVPVTSGPVSMVSAQSQPASSMPQDSAPPPPGLLDDLSPPPPPRAETYEDVMARVGRELSTLPAHTTQPVAAVPPRASVMATTTGTRLPKVRGLFLGFPAPGPKHLDPDASSSFLLHGTSIALGVARKGSSVATSMVRVFHQPASLPAAPAGPHGPSGCFAGPFPGGPSPVRPPTVPVIGPKMTSSNPPALSRIFFRVPRPLLSKPPQHLRHRPLPAWTLSIPRRSRMQGPFPRDLPRSWSKGGKKNSWSTWKPIGNSLLVTLHLSKQWVPLFLLRTWAPTRCGS